MSRLLNSEFLTDPVDFVRRKVLSTTEAETRFIQQRAVHFDSVLPEVQEVFHYAQVSGDNRVLYGDIEPGRADRGFRGAHVVEIEAQHRPGRFPLFWLPFKRNEHRKITLRDERDPAEGRRSGGEPRIFFTSALDGCSIFIEGTLEEPTVTHANAASHRVTSGAPDDGATRQDRIARTTEMERGFSLLPKPRTLRDPLRHRHQRIGPTAAFHGEHYLPNYLRTDPQQEQLLEGLLLTQGLNQLGLTPPQIESSKVDHSAFVFGFRSRDTGCWEFWVQQRARVRVKVPGRILPESVYIGRQIRKLWPGNDYLHIRGNHPYNAVFVSRR